MSVVNPYDFLGVNESSSMAEVRRAFYQLSLVCHPDKGGYAGDMRTLQSAYEWIGHHIDTVREHGDETYEQKEQNFKEFLESQQEEKILSWDEVLLDVLNLKGAGFDELYDRHKVDDDDYTKRIVAHLFFSRMRHVDVECVQDKVREQIMRACIRDMTKAQSAGYYHASIQDGYGSFLQNVPEDITAPIHDANLFGRQEMIVYHEPSAMTLSHPVGADACPVAKLDDYSVGSLCDYRLAHQDTDKPLEKLHESMKNVFEANVNDQFVERQSWYGTGMHGSAS